MARFLDRSFLVWASDRMGVFPTPAVVMGGTPDIACEPPSEPPFQQWTIIIGEKYLKAPKAEREKRIVHELLHMQGMSHDRKMRYTTRPETDWYSLREYLRLIEGRG